MYISNMICKKNLTFKYSSRNVLFERLRKYIHTHIEGKDNEQVKNTREYKTKVAGSIREYGKIETKEKIEKIDLMKSENQVIQNDTVRKNQNNELNGNKAKFLKEYSFSSNNTSNSTGTTNTQMKNVKINNINRNGVRHYNLSNTNQYDEQTHSTQIYMNKLHDYLNVVQKFESEKHRISKIVRKLKSEHVTIESILTILKNLCDILVFKKNTNFEHGNIAINYLDHKHFQKKIKISYEEHFNYMENYLTQYACFINEQNIFDLFKYLYYLNYSLSFQTMELLQERLCSCLDKLDVVQTVQLYYIIHSMYEHFYYQPIDVYLTIVVDEKIKQELSKGLLSADKKKVYNILQGEERNKSLMNSSTNLSDVSEEYINNKMNSFSTNNIKENENHSKENLIIKSIEKELTILTIFKYISHCKKSMNFIYNSNIRNFVEQNIHLFSLDTQLVLLDLYSEGSNKKMNKRIIQRIIPKIHEMNEYHLVLLTKSVCSFLQQLKLHKKHELDNEEIEDIAFKIIEKIQKEKELTMPEPMASLLLNLYELIQLIQKNRLHEIIKKEEGKEKKVSAQSSEVLSIKIQRNNKDNLLNMVTNEIMQFCDNNIQNVTSFNSILSLYLIYIKSESIKDKTINVFEQKIKTNKHKLVKQDISNIILSLSMHPTHSTTICSYLENIVCDRLDKANSILESNTKVQITSGDLNEFTVDKNKMQEAWIQFETHHLIDISMALGIIGKKNLKIWNYIDIQKIILTCDKPLLLYLAYSFLLTNYACPVSWYFMVKRIVEDPKGFNKKQYELVYEILKYSILFNYVDIKNFMNQTNESMMSFSKQPKEKDSTVNGNGNFVKAFQYLINTSYYHYKAKLIKNQYHSKVPYEEIFAYLKLNYEKNIEFKQIYIIPYLLKDYNIIIDPLPATPIHKVSGYILGEVQLRHKILHFDNYTVLSFYDSMWTRFLIEDHQEPSMHNNIYGSNQNTSDNNGMERKHKMKYDVPAMAERFKTYIESYTKKENTYSNHTMMKPILYKESKTNEPNNYLVYKRTKTTTESNRKYLKNKTNKEPQTKYLKVKTRVSRSL